MMAPRSVFGANERVRMGVIGLNQRGAEHILGYLDCPDAEIVALCDVDENVLGERAHQVEAKTGKKPKTFFDLREMLQDPGIDAVSIATPNHWHAPAAIWACQAGKDVYVEKPMSHTLWEGQQLVAAAKKYNRVVQHGTQRRSNAKFMRDINALRSGEVIGPIYMARIACFKRREAVPPSNDEAPPAHLHWRLWQGPAPEKPYNKRYVHYNWHWFWHYGNGECGNNGPHMTDAANWVLDKGLPVKISGAGGRFGYADGCETPNTQLTTFTFADGTLLQFEVRGLATNGEEGLTIGNAFYASDGYYTEEKGFFDNKGKPIALDDSKFPAPKDTGPNGHFANFVRAVKSRNPEDIHGTAHDGHIASAFCHLGNIAYRLGRTLEFDPQTETFKNAPDANALLTRKYHPEFAVSQLA
jgi:predicted dehydrogenase